MTLAVPVLTINVETRRSLHMMYFVSHILAMTNIETLCLAAAAISSGNLFLLPHSLAQNTVILFSRPKLLLAPTETWPSDAILEELLRFLVRRQVFGGAAI